MKDDLQKRRQRRDRQRRRASTEARLFTATLTPSGSIVTGSNPEKLRRAVEAELDADAERFGSRYDYECLAVNVVGVNADVDDGRISKPETFDDWVTAIVEEYRSNLSAMTPESTAFVERVYRSQFGSDEERETFEGHMKA